MLAVIATDWVAEFRSTHILFARFSGVHFHGTDQLPALATLAQCIRAAIDGNGGLRLKFGTDDKGLILLAGWGLQSRSFENNAERALTAAVLVQDAARLTGYEAAIGITGGKVLAGLVGSDRHMEYTVIGDAVNRAAALSGGGRENPKCHPCLAAKPCRHRADFLFESARLLGRAPPKTTGEALIKAMGSFAGYRLRPHRSPQPDSLRDPMISAAEINMTLSEIHYELNKVPFSLAEVPRGINLARSGGGDSTTLAKIYWAWR